MKINYLSEISTWAFILEYKNKKENNKQRGRWTWFGPITFKDFIIHFDKHENSSWSQFQDYNILENKNKKENKNQSRLRTWFGQMTFRNSIMHFDKYSNSF